MTSRAFLDEASITDDLAQRATDLSCRLDRLVPVFSASDASSTPELLDPDCIPLLILNRGESIVFDQGTSQFSTTQIVAAETTIQDLHPRTYSPEIIVRLIERLQEQSASIGRSYGFRENIRAATYSEGALVSGDRFKERFNFESDKIAKVVRFSFRPLVCVYVSNHDPVSNAAALFHELAHVCQIEKNPITGYSSQHEADMKALHDELEAYHVGSVVLSLLASATDAAGQPPRRNDSLDTQALVESLRINNPALDHADPFHPSRSMIMLLESSGIGVKRLIESKANISEILQQ